MKVLYHHRTLADGAEGIHIEEIARALRGLGHDVEIWSLIGGQTNVQTARVSTLGRIKSMLPKALYELMEVGYGAPAALQLLSRMKSFAPDFVYERYSCANAAGIIAKTMHRIPLILEVNSPLVMERKQFEDGIVWSKLLDRVEREVFKRADRCIVVSTPLSDYLQDMGTPAENIEVMPNGADPERFDPSDTGADVREKYGLGNNLVIGFSGVVRPWHGVELLINAVAKLNDAKPQVLIVGAGPAVDSLMQLANRCGIAERIHITGRIAHADMPKYLAACDITVSPRATFYASPMKIPEYMAAGRCVVAPKMPNIENLIDDGRTGLLFEAESETSLREVLQRLVSDDELRASLANTARREVETRLNWRRNASRVVEIGQEIIDRRSGEASNKAGAAS